MGAVGRAGISLPPASTVMVALVATIHVFARGRPGSRFVAGRRLLGASQDVDGRDKPDHDGEGNRDASFLLPSGGEGAPAGADEGGAAAPTPAPPRSPGLPSSVSASPIHLLPRGEKGGAPRRSRDAECCVASGPGADSAGNPLLSGEGRVRCRPFDTVAVTSPRRWVCAPLVQGPTPHPCPSPYRRGVSRALVGAG